MWTGLERTCRPLPEQLLAGYLSHSWQFLLLPVVLSIGCHVTEIEPVVALQLHICI